MSELGDIIARKQAEIEPIANKLLIDQLHEQIVKLKARVAAAEARGWQRASEALRDYYAKNPVDPGVKWAADYLDSIQNPVPDITLDGDGAERAAEILRRRGKAS